jgi:hypothetical protein
LTVSALGRSSSSLIDWANDNNTSDGSILNHVTQQSDQSYQPVSAEANISDSGVNDVTSLFNITTEYDQNVSYPSNMTNNGNLVAITTLSPKSYSRRPIYIRGHLLHHPSPDKRIFHSAEGSSRALRAPNSVDYLQEETDDTNSRKKRKHRLSWDRVHNYKMVFDISRVRIEYLRFHPILSPPLHFLFSPTSSDNYSIICRYFICSFPL